MKMRPIEMAIAKIDGSWYAAHFIEIPDDTPEDKVEAVATEIFLAHPTVCEVAHIWVYNSMDDSRP